MEAKKLLPLAVALKASEMLSALAVDGEAVHFDALASAVSDAEYDQVEMDSVCADSAHALLSFVSFLGVKDDVIEDMIAGDRGVSCDMVGSLSVSFNEKYTQEEVYALAEEFADQFEYDDEVSMDAVSPQRCKSGYKRKMVIKHGKPTWKCVRLSGRTHMSAKQKQALAKARRKSHTALAKYSRTRSMKIGKQKGLHS
ncbi:MAG: hypothetical protein ABXS91_08530 [Sulfurimonas sp.]